MTLLELLMVIVIIGILAALLFPAIGKVRNRSRQSKCISNLRQIGVAAHVFANEHRGRFPSQVPASEGGALGIRPDSGQGPEQALPYRVFQALSNELVDPRLLICPSDRIRTNADSFASLRPRNICYAYNPLAIPLDSAAFVAWDSPGDGQYDRLTHFLLQGGNCYYYRFIHDGQCDIVYGDGRVQGLTLGRTMEDLAARGLMPTLLAGSPPSFSGNGGDGGSRDSGSSLQRNVAGGASRGSGAVGSAGGQSAMSVLEQTFGAKAEPTPNGPRTAQSRSTPTGGGSPRNAAASGQPLSEELALVPPSTTNQAGVAFTTPPAAKLASAGPPAGEPPEAVSATPTEPLLALAKPKVCWTCWILLALFAVLIGVFLAWLLERRHRAQQRRAADADSTAPTT